MLDCRSATRRHWRCWTRPVDEEIERTKEAWLTALLQQLEVFFDEGKGDAWPVTCTKERTGRSAQLPARSGAGRTAAAVHARHGRAFASAIAVVLRAVNVGNMQKRLRCSRS